MGKRGETGMHNLGRTMEKCNAWKGGRHPSRGYIYIYKPCSPLSNSKGYVSESRYVMSKHIGRTLSRKEIIHHKNGIKTDNRIENLELITRKKHITMHNIQEIGRNAIVSHQHKNVTCSGCGEKFITKRKPRSLKSYCTRQCYENRAISHLQTLPW